MYAQVTIDAKLNRDEEEKQLLLHGLEIIEVQAPLGKIVHCAKQGSALVPVAKVAIYAMGKQKKYPEEELRKLQELKQKDRKSFDAESMNERRLEEIKKLKHNYERSQEMFESIKKIGMTDSVEDLGTIIKHLLAVGEKVEVQNLVKHPSQFDGPLGKLTVLSTWTVLPDGARYLSTLQFIPQK